MQYAVLNRNERPTLFPTRTLLLMLLSLAAFGRLWCVTHQQQSNQAVDAPIEVRLATPDAGVP